MAAVYIIEGVPGSGKDTFCEQLLSALRPEERPVFAFSEDAVLATWLYYFISGIHDVRLDLADRIVAYVGDVLARDPDSAFVFNRFHVSYAIWRREHNAATELEERHRRLVAVLKGLPVQIFHALLPESSATERSRHVERRELAWRRFLEERLAFRPDSDIGASYLKQQVVMSEILAADGLPFRPIEVGPGLSIPDLLSSS